MKIGKENYILGLKEFILLMGITIKKKVYVFQVKSRD